MQYYKPARGRRVVNKKRVAIAAVIIALIVIAIVFFAVMASGVKLTPEKEQELYNSGTFNEGVSVAGVLLGGQTYAQGEEKIKLLADGMMNDNKIEYSVKDNSYSYALADAGVSVDYETPLKEAMLHGREGTRWELTFGKTEPKDFPISYAFDETKLNALVDADSASWGEEAIEASFAVDKKSSEDNLTTSGTIVSQAPKDGWKVDPNEIKTAAKQQIESNSFSPITATVEVVKAGNGAAPAGELILMGKATTTIGGGSSPNRKYNIWKIIDKLNGAVFHSGEVFSVNDYVGDRTEKLGWPLAPGIENGSFSDQAGGGICQVSSTMYNAALKAEMDIVARVPHTIMAKYVDPGMDATISTGGPDFKVKNKLDTDMVMIVKCSIPDSKVTVEIYGTLARDYYLKFTPEKIAEQPLPEVTYKTNATLGKYEVKRLKGGQPGEQYQIWGQKYDSKTEKPVDDKYKVTTSTYNPIAPVWELGSGVPVPAAGTAVEDVKATAAAAAAAEEAAKNPQPSVSPPPSTPSAPSASPTPDPVQDPALKPAA
ncbi:MAG: VanW family protein [Christensenella sp.]